MTTEELIAVLYWLSKETISLPCPGCGYEADICVPGCCMILREAAERIAALEQKLNEKWIEIDLLKEAMTNEAD